MLLSRNIPYLIFIFCILSVSTNLKAQNRSSRTADGVYAEDIIAPITTSGWYVGAAVGFNQFYGDMSDESFYKKFSGETKPIISLHLGKEMTPWMALQLEIVSGKLYSLKDKFEDGRSANLEYSGSYFDIAATAKFPITKLIWPYSNSKFSGYIIGGAGLAFWKGDLYLQGSSEPIDKRTNGNGNGIVIPMGLGVHYDLNDKFSLFSEISDRLVLSDKVDRIVGGSKIDAPLVFKIGINYHLSRLDYFKAPPRKKTRRTTTEKKVEPKKKVCVDGGQVSSDDCNLLIMEYDKTSDIRKIMDATTKSEVKSIVTPKNVFDIQNQPKLIDHSPKPKVASWQSTMGDEIFRVQFLATGVRKNMTSLYSKYGSDNEIFEYQSGSIYKYSMGKFKTYTEALNYSRTLHSRGIYDAFIVVFKDGQQIRLTSEMKKY
ncbi:MAG: hypothetical protein JEZ03_07820 [Bacteroidales bacterium]|nr:hypothetical protein [Bacteroidales bacterium]